MPAAKFRGTGSQIYKTNNSTNTEQQMRVIYKTAFCDVGYKKKKSFNSVSHEIPKKTAGK
jgi:hypothetical protein